MPKVQSMSNTFGLQRCSAGWGEIKFLFLFNANIIFGKKKTKQNTGSLSDTWGKIHDLTESECE